jgi:hypothetical protein
MGGTESKGEQQPIAMSRKVHTTKANTELRPKVHTTKACIVSMEYNIKNTDGKQ